MRVKRIRFEQQGKFSHREFTCAVPPIQGRGYLHRGEKGLVKNGAVGLQQTPDTDRALLVEITLDQSAGVEEENYNRSSRSSIIWRLKPASLFVIRKTRFMSARIFMGPIRESSPGQPLRPNPFANKCRSRACFVHFFRAVALPFDLGVARSLACAGAAAAR